MKKTNRQSILEKIIEDFQKNNELIDNNNSVFELFSLNQIMKANDVSFENITNSIVDGGNDGGIDSIVIIHRGECLDIDSDHKFDNDSKIKLIISQCKKESSFSETSIDKLISTIPVLFNSNKTDKELKQRFNDQILEKKQIFNKAWEEILVAKGSLEIYINYITFADKIEVNQTFKSKKDQLEGICKDLFVTDKVVFKCYSCSELIDLYQSKKTTNYDLEFQPLSSKSYGNEIGYIGLVRLRNYKKFLTNEDGTIKEELFESNVRHFQGTVDVNKRIKQTLEYNHQNKDFWWLNNGITIIAKNASQRGDKLYLENPQIVNGLQTSYSIYNVDLDDQEERSVLLKLIINNDNSILEEIIEATNYQNPISVALLKANEKIQKEIDLFFNQKGYYYDRQKNYYKNQGKPENKIFSISFLAQAIKSIILKEPHTARATPTTLLKSENSYNTIFQDSIKYESYLNCCLIVSKIHRRILNLEDKQQKNDLLNFKLHTSMIAVCMFLKKLDYNADDISNINIENFEDIINSAIETIKNILIDYKNNNPNMNIPNIAKESNFTNYIKNALITKE